MLAYYVNENRAFSHLQALKLSTAQAALLIEEMVEIIGERPVGIEIRTRVSRWVYYAQGRKIVLTHPDVSVLAVLHEIAHIWHWNHNIFHATAVSLLVAILESEVSVRRIERARPKARTRQAVGSQRSTRPGFRSANRRAS